MAWTPIKQSLIHILPTPIGHYLLDLNESTVDVEAIQSAFVTFNYGHQNLKHVVVIDFIIINLDRTLQLVQLRHVIVGFQGDVN